MLSGRPAPAWGGRYGNVTAVPQPDGIQPLERVVVVGASLAGLRACETLRTEGFGGTITLVGAERAPALRPPAAVEEAAGRRVGARPDRPPQAGRVRRARPRPAPRRAGRPGSTSTTARVALADGSRVPFDGVVIATGSRTRRLPGQDAVPDVHELRTLDDSLAPARRDRRAGRRGSSSSAPGSSASRSPRPRAPARLPRSPCSKARRRR